jgi:hypothetical protein
VGLSWRAVPRMPRCHGNHILHQAMRYPLHHLAALGGSGRARARTRPLSEHQLLVPLCTRLYKLSVFSVSAFISLRSGPLRQPGSLARSLFLAATM